MKRFRVGSGFRAIWRGQWIPDRGRTRFLGLAALLLLLTGLAACAGDTAPMSDATFDGLEANVVLTEFTIELEPKTLPVGSVRFLVANQGSVEHDMYLERPGAEGDALKGPEGNPVFIDSIKPGGKAVLEFEFEVPGETYQLGCHLPGHYEAGMVTTFTVGD